MNHRVRTFIATLFVVFLAVPQYVSAQPVPSDALVRRKLAADTVISGIPCAKSGKAPAEFHRSGPLAGCALSRAFQIGTHSFPAATWVDLNASGVLWGVWLSNDTQLDGHLCRGEGYKAWSVRFHSNGKLSGCYLVEDTVLEGVPCMRGTFLRELRGGGHTSLQLYSDGKFRSCQAARDTVVAGRAVRKWEVFKRDSVP